MSHRLSQAQQRYQIASDALSQLELRQILQRGYALVKKEDAIVSRTNQVQTGDSLTIELQDGHLEVEVNHVQNTDI